MRPRRDLGIGRRRDNGVRSIRTDDVRYPGVELPVLDDTAPSTPSVSVGRLAPARDTGIAVETPGVRQRRRAMRRQRRAVLATAVAVSVLLLAGIGWRYASDRKAAATPFFDFANTAQGANATTSSPSASDGASRQVPATPIFAHYGKLQLHLPVPITALTEIGFHQASYPYALHLKTTMADADLSKVVQTKTTGRVASKQPTGPNAVMTGKVIRMWRSRPGRPDTAADVGASPGTKVLAPVDGTIVKIKPYLLYGRYPDFEVHIAPEGVDGIDLVMIHLTNIDCSVGDVVIAGVTPLARVRKLSDLFHDQLADYTKGGGNHVHIQVNNANYPGYRGLQGAIEPNG